MRREILLLITSLMSHQTYAQKLSGTFETHLNKGVVSFEYEQLRFAGSHFSYLMVGCTDIATGYGTFRLLGDSLILHFEDSTATIASIIPAPARCLVPGYCCTVIDVATRQPLVDAPVTLYRQWPGKRLTAFTDDEGRVAFSDDVRPASPQPDSCLSIDAFRYRPVSIALPAGSSQSFVARLTPKGIAANTIFRYRVFPGPPDQLLLNDRRYQLLTERRKRKIAREEATLDK